MPPNLYQEHVAYIDWIPTLVAISDTIITMARIGKYRIDKERGARLFPTTFHVPIDVVPGKECPELV